MYRTKHTIFEDFHAAPENTLSDAGNVGHANQKAKCADVKKDQQLKKVLNKNYTQLGNEPAKLARLIAHIPFQHAVLHAKVILDHVYDWSGTAVSLLKERPRGKLGGAHQYFLGQFALAEGEKGGQYFIPKTISNFIVKMIKHYQDRVYVPTMNVVICGKASERGNGEAPSQHARCGLREDVSDFPKSANVKSL